MKRNIKIPKAKMTLMETLFGQKRKELTWHCNELTTSPHVYIETDNQRHDPPDGLKWLEVMSATAESNSRSYWRRRPQRPPERSWGKWSHSEQRANIKVIIIFVSSRSNWGLISLCKLLDWLNHRVFIDDVDLVDGEDGGVVVLESREADVADNEAGDEDDLL